MRRRLKVWWFSFRNFLCWDGSRGAWTPVSLSLCQQNTAVHIPVVVAKEFPSNYSLRREFEAGGPRRQAPARTHSRTPLPTLALHQRHPPAGASAPPGARRSGAPALAAASKSSSTCVQDRVLQPETRNSERTMGTCFPIQVGASSPHGPGSCGPQGGERRCASSTSSAGVAPTVPYRLAAEGRSRVAMGYLASWLNIYILRLSAVRPGALSTL